MSGDGFALESAPACMCGRRVPAFAIVPRIVPWSSLGMSCSWGFVCVCVYMCVCVCVFVCCFLSSFLSSWMTLFSWMADAGLWGRPFKQLVASHGSGNDVNECPSFEPVQN